MPYRDPERNRRWEQAHRQQRTARRKAQRHASPLPTESPSSECKDKGSSRPWAILLLTGVAILAAIFFGFAGASGSLHSIE